MQEQALIERLSKGRVAVVGDLMLDQYVYGEVERISPEAPVPILHVTLEKHVLGGAANVAHNIAALGGRAALLGFIGNDDPGSLFMDLLSQLPGVEPMLQFSPAHPTTLKTRFVCRQQQIVRVDRGALAPYPTAAMRALMEDGLHALDECDGLVLSDYGKGVLTDEAIQTLIEAAKLAGKFVVVDPKRKNFAAYSGATYITPNRKELSEAVGLPCLEDAQAQQAAHAAIAQSGAAILLTRSERGMSLFREGSAPIHLAAEAREVFDVSGAGDTVVAALALGLASSLPVEQAMLAANHAAGVVVGKSGTAVCTPGELLAAFRRRVRRADEHGLGGAFGPEVGLTRLEDAAAIRKAWAGEGLSVGFANGCFDLIHPGHVSLLRQAAAACDRLIVAINTDASVARLKGPARPVQDAAARAQVLCGIKGVDLVVAFDEDTPLEILTVLQPDLIVKGSDYREDQVVGADLVKARGGRVLLVDLVDGQSTSAIVKRANAGP